MGEDRALVGDEMAAQSQQAISNAQAVPKGASIALADVVQCMACLTGTADFEIMNAVYADALGGYRPARATLMAAGLSFVALVEIDMIARERAV